MSNNPDNKDKENYNNTYQQSDSVFGSEPEQILQKLYSQIDKDCPIIDIGAGQGRNSLFLSQLGYQVDALDPSTEAVEQIKDKCRSNDLNINTIRDDFLIAPLVSDNYSAVLVFGLIQILNRTNLTILVSKISDIIRPGGLVFVTAFGTADPSFKTCQNSWKQIEPNTFIDNTNRTRLFLEKNEILDLFEGFDVLHYWEGVGQEHRHGDGPVEQHYMVESVFKASMS